MRQTLQGFGMIEHDEMSLMRSEQPPANHLVFVTTGMPYESSGLFEAVNVTGMFGTASTSAQLADIGYVLSAGVQLSLFLDNCARRL